VIDDGNGIPTDQVDALLQPFRRAKYIVHELSEGYA
jgi:signal transduction histidine kinase